MILGRALPTKLNIRNFRDSCLNPAFFVGDRLQAFVLLLSRAPVACSAFIFYFVNLLLPFIYVCAGCWAVWDRIFVHTQPPLHRRFQDAGAGLLEFGLKML